MKEKIIDKDWIILLELDKDKKVTYSNKRYRIVTEYRKEEILGESFYNFLHSDFDINFIEESFKLIDSGCLWHCQIKTKTRHNKYIWTETFIKAIFEDENNIRSYIIEKKATTKDKKILNRLLETNFNEFKQEYSNFTKFNNEI